MLHLLVLRRERHADGCVSGHRHGFAVETTIRGVTVDDQSHERYFINENLLQMIRDSPHNTKVMTSLLVHAATTPVATAPATRTEGAADAASAVIRSV